MNLKELLKEIGITEVIEEFNESNDVDDFEDTIREVMEKRTWQT